MSGTLLGFIIAFVCFGVGCALLQALKLNAEDDEIFVYGTAAGLAVLSNGVLFLGLIGKLEQVTILGWIVLLAIFALTNFERKIAVLVGTYKKWRYDLSMSDMLYWSVLLLTLIIALIATWSPTIQNDSLCYHLHVPKLFLKNRSIGPLPHEVNALFPFFMEMFFTLGLALHSLALAKFFSFLCGLLMAGAFVMFMRRYVSLSLAWLGAILLITTPSIVSQLSSTYVDIGLGLYTLLSIISFLRWADDRNWRWIVLSGVFAGIMMSIKYLALTSVGITGFMVIVELLRRGDRIKRKALHLSLFVGSVMLVCGYWYLRAYIETGNPVYPYFASFFKAGISTTGNYDHLGLDRNIINFFISPLVVVLNPSLFGGFSETVGPAYLAFIPYVFLSSTAVPFSASLLFFVFFFYLSWYVLSPMVRFWIPVLPFIMILIVSGMSYFVNKRVSRWRAGVVLAVVLFHLGFAVYHFRNELPVALGFKSAKDYLKMQERTYGIAEFLNENLTQSSKTLAVNEVRLYYFQTPIVRENIYYFDTNYSAKASVDEVLDELLLDGFTHILYVNLMPFRGTSEEGLRLPQLLESNDPGLMRRLSMIHRYETTGFEGRKIEYILYLIKDDRKLSKRRSDRIIQAHPQNKGDVARGI